MSTRSYNQLCNLALALDVIGERWTLLIVRELAGGPRRFSDLLVGLPGISTNLLTERLKSLEEFEVIKRRALPPPAASTVYELTERGHGLEPSILALAQWGNQFVAKAGAACRPLHLGSYALTPQIFFRPELAAGVDKTYALFIDGEAQTVRIVNNAIDLWQGEPSHYDMALFGEIRGYLRLLTNRVTPLEAMRSGLVRVEGDPAELTRFIELCGMPVS